MGLMFIQTHMLWKACIYNWSGKKNHYLKSCGWIFTPTDVPYLQHYTPNPLTIFNSWYFCTYYQCHIDLQNKTSYFVNWRRNHPYNRSTFWQPPMHPLHLPWNKRTFHAEKQVYFIYFKIKNYFELSVHTLYHGYSVK